MKQTIFFASGHTAALQHTIIILKQEGFSFSDKADNSVTHLLLPVPSFDTDGTIKGGGPLDTLLQKLPKEVTIIGGNLNRPELENYKTIDLLCDETYLAHNASITAYCAIRLGMQKLPITLSNCPVLVIGWGRIGKCLAHLLRQLGADVTVAARKAETRAALSSLGYKAIDTVQINSEQYRLIYNTAPSMVCHQCPGNALKIDLASEPGIGGLDILWARGLPGKDAPESSGTLIAKTITESIFRKEFKP